MDLESQQVKRSNSNPVAIDIIANNAKSYFGTVSDQLRLSVSHIFVQVGILGWIRSGHGIQNPFVKCQIHRFDDDPILLKIVANMK